MKNAIRVQSVAFPERNLGPVGFMLKLSGFGLPEREGDRLDYPSRFFSRLCSKQ